MLSVDPSLLCNECNNTAKLVNPLLKLRELLNYKTYLLVVLLFYYYSENGKELNGWQQLRIKNLEIIKLSQEK